MTLKDLQNKLSTVQVIKDKHEIQKTLGPKEILHLLSADPVFIGIVQSVMKKVISKYKSTSESIYDLIRNGDKITADHLYGNIDEYYSEFSSDDPIKILTATEKYLNGINLGDLENAYNGVTDTSKKSDTNDILKIEMIISYEEAAKLRNITKQIFGITMDSDFAQFEILTQATIKGTGDGSEKFQGWPSWSGIDMVVTAVMGNYVKFIPDFGTISYSIRREKVDVRPLGSVNRRGHTTGPRTIAGSMIGVILREEPLKGLQPNVINDLSALDQLGSGAQPYRENMLPDQLPDFDLLITIQNEYGHAARIGLFGITIIDTGQTTSIQDMQTEIVYQYTATDIDLLSYSGFGDDSTSFDLGLEAYKERRDRINSGKTLHNSPFDVPEFWDVWDPDKRIVLDPGDLLSSVDLGAQLKLDLAKLEKNKIKNTITPKQTNKYTGDGFAKKKEIVPDCDISITDAYIIDQTSKEKLANDDGIPPPHDVTNGDTNDELIKYCSVKNMITKRSASLNNTFSVLKDNFVSGKLGYGWAWQTEANKNMAYLKLEEPVRLKELKFYLMTGESSYKKDSTIYKNVKLLDAHQLPLKIDVEYLLDGLLIKKITYPISGTIPDPTGGHKNIIHIIGISNDIKSSYIDAICVSITELTSDRKDSNVSFGFLDHTAISAIVPVGKMKSMISSDTAVKPKCPDLSITSTPSMVPEFNPENKLEKKNIDGPPKKVKLKVINTQGEGTSPYYLSSNVVDWHSKEHQSSAYSLTDTKDPVKSMTIDTPPGSPTNGDRYIVPEGSSAPWDTLTNNIVEWNGTSWTPTVPVANMTTQVEDETNKPFFAYDTLTTSWKETKITEEHGWAWEPIGTAAYNWSLNPKTFPISVLVTPDDDKPFYFSSASIVKGFARINYNLTGSSRYDLPYYFKTPHQVKVTVYLYDSTKTFNSTTALTWTETKTKVCTMLLSSERGRRSMFHGGCNPETLLTEERSAELELVSVIGMKVEIKSTYNSLHGIENPTSTRNTPLAITEILMMKYNSKV